MNKIATIHHHFTPEQGNALQDLLRILNDMVSVQPQQLLSQPNFTDFFKVLMFGRLEIVRLEFAKILSLFRPRDLESIAVSHLEHSKRGNCGEYFQLVGRIANSFENPKQLWRTVFHVLKANLFARKENLDMANCEGDSGLEESVSHVTAQLADSQFVSGSVDIMFRLLGRIEGRLHRITKVFQFVYQNIIFNVHRYIPVPAQGFQFLETVCSRYDNLVLPFIAFLQTLHDASVNDGYQPYLTCHSSARGIHNMGCTCYLNASLQQVFRIQKVRNAILSYEPKPDVDLDTDWMCQLTLLFTRLSYAPSSFVDASPFVRNWKDWGGLPVNPREQQDANEFLLMLFDRIDEVLPDKPVAEAVLGKMVHQVVGMNDDFKSDREEPFPTFGLEVRNNSNFAEAFAACLVPDSFTNENKYDAGEGYGKINANIFHSILTPPETLIFQLKRFDWDMSTQQRCKINSLFEYPIEADISSLLAANQGADFHDPLFYELCGVVVHSGSAQSGHYYSYVKDEVTNDWFCCNDSTVSPAHSSFFLTATRGGKVNVTTVDPRTKERITVKRDNPESAYLLVYKRKGRELPDPNLEPISLLSKRMLQAYLDDLKRTILKVILPSYDYMNLVQSITKHSQRPEIFEFLFAYLFKLIMLPMSGHAVQQIVNLVSEKLKSDSQFGAFLLSKSDQLISFLLESEYIASRDHLVSVVNTALKSSQSPEFVTRIIEQEDILSHWKSFDQIFQPVYFYIKEFNYYNDELLDNFFTVLVKKIPSYLAQNPRERDTCLQSINLSHLFKTLLKLITGLNKADVYENQIIDDQFMSNWFASPAHSFDIAALITYFLRDNQAHTDKYLEFISKTKSVGATAAHFASACSFNDSLRDSRVKWFFNFIKQQKWEQYELGNFIRETANKLSGDDACLALMTVSELWLKDWIITTESTVRSPATQLVYAMFRSHPVVRSVTAALASDNIQGTEIERQQLPILFDSLINMSKQLVTAAKNGSALVYQSNVTNPSHVPTSTYFELLTWAICHGKLQGKLVEKKQLLLKMLGQLANLKNNMKCGLTDFVHFLSPLDLGPTFWDRKSITSLLDIIAKLPLGDGANSYLDTLIPDAFPLLQKLAPHHANLIANSKILKKAIQTRLDAGNGLSQYVHDLIISLISQPEAIGPLCGRLFQNAQFRRHFDARNRMIINLVKQLLEKGSIVALEEFKDQQCHQVVLENLLRQMSAETTRWSFTFMTEDLNLLTAFSNQALRVFQLRSPKQLKSYWEFWKANRTVMESIGTLLQQANTPLGFAETAVAFLEAVWTKPGPLVPLAQNYLKAQPEDLYSKIHRDITKKFARFAVAAFEGTLAEAAKYFVRELGRLAKFEMFNPDVFVAFVGVLKKCQESLDIPAVVPICDQFVMNADDLTCFGIGQFAVKLLKDREEMKAAWIRKGFGLLIAQVAPEMSEVVAEGFLPNLKAFKQFLQAVKYNEEQEVDKGLLDVVNGLKEAACPRAQEVGFELEFLVPLIGPVVPKQKSVHGK
jgi:hypothetical protein